VPFQPNPAGTTTTVHVGTIVTTQAGMAMMQAVVMNKNARGTMHVGTMTTVQAGMTTL